MNTILSNGLNISKIGKSARQSIDFQLKEANSYIMEILSFISSQNGTVIQDFYIGTTDDFKNKLFKSHRINSNDHNYVVYDASTQRVADEVIHQLREMGMNGYFKPNGGRFIYCYKIGDRTVEWCN